MSADAAAALRHYGLSFAGADPLGNRGGFSGARLWRVPTPAGPLCLRAWPVPGPPPERLDVIHSLMDAAVRAGLEFVPPVVRTVTHQTWVSHAGRLWDLTAWMPGRADFHERPGVRRLEGACSALARLHTVWRRQDIPPGPCPAVRRRLDGAAEWAALVGSGWRPAFPPHDDPVTPWAERAWRLLGLHLPRLTERLAPWAAAPFSLQPCLCDVWHDHVLFEGDAVTGLVDYGSVKLDHVTADLARLLGSLVPDDPELTAAGLEAYARLRPLSPQEQALVAVLDETGTLLGAATWLRWLYHDGRRFDDRPAVARRLAGLVVRLERREASGPLPG
jgi:Ser/Thr protein kinase RdoA (MazF antagonist)